MLRKLFLILTTALVFTSVEAAPIVIPQAPNINAKSYVLMDANSGAVIAAKNPNAKLPPASLTKLMTVYLTFNALKNGTIHLNDKVRVSKVAWKTGGSRMFLRVGSYPTVNQLIQGIIVDSGNDACVAVSEYIAGSQAAFVQMMNAEAKKLGMKNSHFSDVNGLPIANHYSTAHDLALLTQAIIKDFPQDYHYFSQKWFTYNNIKQPNRNRLLWRYKYADGLKTGHTSQAGYCLIGSAEKNGMRLISVVMGTPSDEARSTDSQTLLAYGFRYFDTHQVYAANKAIRTQRVYLGENKEVPIGVAQNLYVTLPDGQFKNAKTDIALKTPIKAPVKKDQVLGAVTISLDGKPIVQAPVVALKADPRGGFWRRFSDHIALGFSRFFGSSKKN